MSIALRGLAAMSCMFFIGCALDVNGLEVVPTPEAPSPPIGVDAGEALSPKAADVAACQSSCAGCCDPNGTCVKDGTATTTCGLGGAACINCSIYAAYCNSGGFCSIDPADAPAGWDGGR